MRDDASTDGVDRQIDMYEVQAEAELAAARAAPTIASRTAHLNEAARYAALSEQQRREPVQHLRPAS